MTWWQIVLIILAALIIGGPIVFCMVKFWITEIIEWRKQAKAFRQQEEVKAMSKEEAMKMATKEFFVAFKPYFDYIEAGEVVKAKQFLDAFYESCTHKTRACGTTLSCPECPYGGLMVMGLIDIMENNDAK